MQDGEVVVQPSECKRKHTKEPSKFVEEVLAKMPKKRGSESKVGSFLSLKTTT